MLKLEFNRTLLCWLGSIGFIFINKSIQYKNLNSSEILKYNLYYFLIYTLKLKLFKLKIYADPCYFVFNFYQINSNNKI